jgi:hypothetical protein
MAETLRTTVNIDGVTYAIVIRANGTVTYSRIGR